MIKEIYFSDGVSAFVGDSEAMPGDLHLELRAREEDNSCAVIASQSEVKEFRDALTVWLRENGHEAKYGDGWTVLRGEEYGTPHPLYDEVWYQCGGRTRIAIKRTGGGAWVVECQPGGHAPHKAIELANAMISASEECEAMNQTDIMRKQEKGG